PAQRADQADEGTRLFEGLPVRPRQRRRRGAGPDRVPGCHGRAGLLPPGRARHGAQAQGQARPPAFGARDCEARAAGARRIAVRRGWPWRPRRVPWPPSQPTPHSSSGSGEDAPFRTGAYMADRIRRRTWMLAGVAVLVMLLLAWAVARIRGPALPGYEVTSGPLVQNVVATGRVAALSRVQVGAEIAGLVLE